ncbi:ABC transporter substrate-binding protein [Enteractinococcus helveticum]|nr:ABC transporter substrate-binding protein [Enteractinococcus helveticum]
MRPLKSSPKRNAIVSFIALSALSLAACGNGAGPSTEGDQAASTNGEMEKITLGVMPLVDLAPLHLGVDQGIFEEHGLEVELVTAQGGAAIIPAVTSGQYEFGFSNPTSVIIAKSQGLDVVVVAPGGTSTGDEETDYGATVVLPDSGIETAADLEGKRVAVNTLNNISDSTVKEAVRNAGGDPNEVEMVELAFPDMVPGVEQGTVDAAFLVEPFLTMGLNAGFEPIAWNWIEVSPDLMASSYFTTQELADEQPELVEKFQNAMAESAQYAEEHPEETRNIITSYTEIPEEITETMRLPRWVDSVDQESLDRLIEISIEDGLLEEDVQLEDLVLQN